MTMVLLTIAIVAGLGTYLLRASFLVLRDPEGKNSRAVDELLSLVPPAVLAALALPHVVRPDGGLAESGARVLAALLAVFIVWRLRSTLGAVIVGLSALFLLGNVVS